LLCALRVLPVNVDTIESIILDHVHTTGGKVLSCRITSTDRIQILLCVGIGPAANAKKDFEVAILLLEEAELLQGTVQVLPRVGPRVAWKMNLGIGVVIAQSNVAVRCVISEGVEEMCQLCGRNLLREVFARINVLSPGN
jgi:hypothetical protein